MNENNRTLQAENSVRQADDAAAQDAQSNADSPGDQFDASRPGEAPRPDEAPLPDDTASPADATMPPSANARPGGEPFNAVLVPHRSLTPRGFFILMAMVSAVCFSSGMVFLVMGAWPVMGFFGLDVLIIYVAFKLNYRSGRMFETLDLDRNNLNITRIHPSGKRESFDFNPYWTRVKLDEGVDGRTSLSVYLHDQAVTFGAFLNDDERREFAGVLRDALYDVKNGRRG